MSNSDSDHLLKLHGQITSARSSLGVRNRQPQGTLVAFTFGTADVFDDTDTADLFLSVPDRVYVLLEVKLWLMFRQFFASAKSASAASSGTLTSASSGTLTSASGGSSSPTSDAALIYTTQDGDHDHVETGGNTVHSGGHWHTAGTNGTAHSHDVSIAGHTHTVAGHDHTVAGHTHALTIVYGVIKETMPASHSVTLKIYNWDDDAAWDLVTTISGITEDVSEHDLTFYISSPGLWRLSLQSESGQPQGGRLGVDASGHVIGAIQSV